MPAAPAAARNCRPDPGFRAAAVAGPDVTLRRLTRRAQFLRAARGKLISRRGFTLQVAPVPEQGSGIGFTVTKKNGSAPARNRIKRRLRAAVAACAEGFETQHDYVVIGRPEALTEPFADLVAGLSGSLKRIHSSRDAAQRTR